MNSIRYLPSLVFIIAAVYFGLLDHRSEVPPQTQPPQAPQADAHVRELTPGSFDSHVLDSTRDAFVMFYAPWCGHCKTFGPAYETIARTFAADSASVTIAKIDLEADEAGMLIAERYNIRGYPTLMWFPKANKEGEPYEGPRDAKEIVQFVNANSGLRRVLGGALEALAGTHAVLDGIAKQFMQAPSDAVEFVGKMEQADAEASVKAVYVKVMQRVLEKGKEYIAREKARMDALLADQSAMSLEKVDEFVKKRNVLAVFAA